MAISRAEVVDYLANMTVLELSTLIKELEEKFGVSACGEDGVKRRCSSRRSQGWRRTGREPPSKGIRRRRRSPRSGPALLPGRGRKHSPDRGHRFRVRRHGAQLVLPQVQVTLSQLLQVGRFGHAGTIGCGPPLCQIVTFLCAAAKILAKPLQS